MLYMSLFAGQRQLGRCCIVSEDVRANEGSTQLPGPMLWSRGGIPPAINHIGDSRAGEGKDNE